MPKSNRNSPIAILLIAATGFAPLPAFPHATCSNYVLPGKMGYSTDLNRIERNGSAYGMTGSMLVDFEHSGLNAKVTTPAATALAKDVSFLLPFGTLEPHSVTEIFVVESMASINGFAASLSKEVKRVQLDDIVLDIDGPQDFVRVYIPSSYFDSALKLKKPLPIYKKDAVRETTIRLPRLKRRKIGALAPSPKKDAKIHVGGLISISAEPPEAFFAAATAAEFGKAGWKVSSAEEANVWVYRVPDSRPDSYFEFTYASPDRPAPSTYQDKFKVATGIGPSTHPESLGGREADLLWLGDEQMGALERYLQKVSSPKLMLEDIYVERGLIQRIDDHRVVLAGVDQRYALTQKGFDQMETDPALYRRVIDKEYDAFLRGLFKDSHPNPNNKSFLLATSRGCSQGCAICCSGGLSQFQYFSAPRMMQELEKLAEYGKMDPTEKFNIFLVDSNFNNNPSRITEFADLYMDSPLRGRFEFFIRHNTVNGFLKPAPGGKKVPNIPLIAAYQKLGIKEVFMGIDSFDDASTITLKTHKFKVAKDGAESRPIYSIGEIKALIAALDEHGLYSKGFFLTNNPWVSDLDRIDAYYNLVDIWIRNPQFSIDSARDRNVIRLKPFDGSPIGETSKLMGHTLVKDGRFVARGPMGEMDEMMEFAGLGRPFAESNLETTLTEFWSGISRIRAGAEKLLRSKDAKKRDYAQWVLSKLIDRNIGFAELLETAERRGSASAKQIRLDIQALRNTHAGIPGFDPAVQKRMFEENIKSLEDGLQKTNPKKGAGL